MMRIILTLFGATILAASAAAAQPIPDWPIEPGSRVRILSPVLGNRGATGSVVSATPDTLVFRAAKESTSTTIATPNIVSIEVARGTHTNTARFTIAGFLLGAMMGTAIGAATHHSPSYNSLDFSQQAAAFGGGLIGGVAGALVGASIGKRPSDTWVPVTLPGR
jgi:outer membrane lipoprotein SlyB